MAGLGGFFRRLLVGERLPTSRAAHERLPKLLALPVFASDAISSSAYAVEEILLALMFAVGGLAHSVFVAAAICVLFAMVAVSYRQTVMAYPSGGGAYAVARDNLGLPAGMLAASALLTDYVLTVAVSIAAGVAAVISAAPTLAEHRVGLCVLFIAFITLANLRGARESGKLFAGPTYLFIASVVLMLVVGTARLALGAGPVAAVANPVVEVAGPLTFFLLLRAFASGCAALTGIEAISNSVPAFRPPESRNAATTLLWMAGICIALFLGITLLGQYFHIQPGGHETVLSKLGRAAFGQGLLYYILQAATMMVLVLAANTSFTGFPRLASILAQDGLAPRQLANLGDRLVFNNGIIVLGLFSAGLVVLFHGKTHDLIPLYAVGVFISFTLSQAGMVRRWLRLRTPGWRVSAIVNGLGAATTATVSLVVVGVKFIHGAWLVLLFIPLLILVFRKIAEHYRSLGAALSMEGFEIPRAVRHAVIVLVPGLHRGVIDAVLYAKSIDPECQAVFVEIDPAETARVQEQWLRHRVGMPLTVLKSPWRSLTEPILHYIRTVRTEKGVDLVTVVIPEFATTGWWHRLLHNQSGLMIKFALMFEPGVVVTNVRYHVEES
jgi:amino acid transporter